MSEIGQKDSTNDHAIREQKMTVPWVGSTEFGMTGFRFVRIDNLSDYRITLRQVFAVYVQTGKKYIGTFKCDDERINKVWDLQTSCLTRACSVMTART